MIMTIAVVTTTREPKEANQDQLLLRIELNDLTVLQVVQVADSAERTADLETMVSEAEDLAIAPLDLARAKLNEAAESIDILKDRQFQ